jgi:hypothetical protein
MLPIRRLGYFHTLQRRCRAGLVFCLIPSKKHYHLTKFRGKINLWRGMEAIFD